MPNTDPDLQDVIVGHFYGRARHQSTKENEVTIFDELERAVIEGKAPAAKELTEKGLKEGIKPHEFFPKAIIPAMDEVGRRAGL